MVCNFLKQHKNKKFYKLIYKILNSKFLVAITIILILSIGYTSISSKDVNADSNYKFGTVYQYYLLSGKGDDLADAGESDKILQFGNLGSSGVQGTFSYNAIVDNGEEKNSTDEARKFVSMMATYSKYNYFSVSQQGFNIILPMLGRWVLGILMIIAGAIYDIAGQIVFIIPNLIAKINIIPWIASIILKSNFIGSDGLAKVLSDKYGISSDSIQNMLSFALSILATSILISVATTFGRGGRNINNRSRNKLTGKLLAFIIIPLGFGVSVQLINSVVSFTNDNSTEVKGNIFQRYLIDDENWAMNYNFAPTGNSREDGEINGTVSSDYVDNTYMPYGNAKASTRIENINSTSDYYSGNKPFSNSAVAIRYAKGDTFTADQYIQYLGTKASSGAYGSYYTYATNWKNKILDVSRMYYSSNNGTPTVLGEAQSNWNFKKALSDYTIDNTDSKDKNKVTSVSQAWRDRFIYGAKSNGDKLEDYYSGVPPSNEQVVNAVGSGREKSYSISDQSMFLVLSTKFTDTGGKYYLTGPARGLLSAGIFDSDRVEYYSFSLVGIPVISALSAISDIVFVLLVWVVALLAILSIGLVEMNVKPIKSAFSALLLGDYEYTIAFCCYSAGVAGTIVMFSLIIGAITTIGFAIPTIITTVFSKVLVGGDYTSLPAEMAMMIGALSPIAMIIMTWLFYVVIRNNVKGCRDILINLFAMPWDVACKYAERFERVASGIRFNNSLTKSRKQDVFQKFANKVGQKTGLTNSDEDVNVFDDIKNGRVYGGFMGIRDKVLGKNIIDDAPVSADDIKRKQFLSSLGDNVLAIPEGTDDEVDSLKSKVMKDLQAYDENPEEGIKLDNVQALKRKLLELGIAPNAVEKISDVEDRMRKSNDVRAVKGVIDEIDDSNIEDKTIKQNVMNNINDLISNPTDAQIDKSISSLKVLEKEMKDSGASPEEIQKVSNAIKSFQALKNPVDDVKIGKPVFDADVKAKVDSIGGLDNLTKDSLKASLDELDVNPTGTNINVAKDLINQAITKVDTPKDLDTLFDAKKKIVDVEYSNAKDSLEKSLSALGTDAVNVDVKTMFDKDGNLDASKAIKLQNDLSSLNGNKVVDNIPNNNNSVKNMSTSIPTPNANSFNGGSTGSTAVKETTSIEKQIKEIQGLNINRQLMGVEKELTENLGRNVSYDVLNAIRDYAQAPNVNNKYVTVKKTIQQAIKQAENTNDTITRDVLAKSYSKLAKINDANTNFTFKNDMLKSLKGVSNDENIKPLVDKLLATNSTKQQVSCSKEIFGKLKETGNINKVDMTIFSRAVKNLTTNKENLTTNKLNNK